MDELIQNVLMCIKKVKDELGDFYKENIYQKFLTSSDDTILF